MQSASKLSELYIRKQTSSGNSDKVGFFEKSENRVTEKGQINSNRDVNPSPSKTSNTEQGTLKGSNNRIDEEGGYDMDNRVSTE